MERKEMLRTCILIPWGLRQNQSGVYLNGREIFFEQKQLLNPIDHDSFVQDFVQD